MYASTLRARRHEMLIVRNVPHLLSFLNRSSSIHVVAMTLVIPTSKLAGLASMSASPSDEILVTPGNAWSHRQHTWSRSGNFAGTDFSAAAAGSNHLDFAKVAPTATAPLDFGRGLILSKGHIGSPTSSSSFVALKFHPRQEMVKPSQ